MNDINESADRIAKAAWETYISTGAFTLSGLRDAVFKELAADRARQGSELDQAHQMIDKLIAGSNERECECSSCQADRYARALAALDSMPTPPKMTYDPSLDEWRWA